MYVYMHIQVILKVKKPKNPTLNTLELCLALPVAEAVGSHSAVCFSFFPPSELTLSFVWLPVEPEQGITVVAV